jgi:hypothetical protein
MSRSRESTQSIDEIRRNSNITDTDKLGLLAVGSVGIGVVSILIGLGNFVAIQGLASKPISPLVQLENGKSIKVAALKDNERTPTVIKNFASLSLIKLMTWNGALPPKNAEDFSNPKPDPGVPIPSKNGANIKVPTSAWQASFTLSSDLQNPFLQNLGKLYTDIQSKAGGRATTRLEILNIGDPIQIEAGVWRVPIIANLRILSMGNVLQTIEFNKDVSVQAIPVPPLLEAGKPEELTLSQLISEGKAGGMHIFNISESRRAEIKPAETLNK